MALLNHIQTSQLLMEQVDISYGEGDLAGAVAKAWEATSLSVKTIAESRGWKSDTPADIFTAMDVICEETNQPDFDILFQAAFILPYNFKEGWLTDQAIKQDIEDVRELLAILEGIE